MIISFTSKSNLVSTLKILKNLIFILTSLILLSSQIRAQQPSHFIIGAEELSGVNIYDIHQDSFLNYWLATNNGIYKYDGYTIKKLYCSEMINNSVFRIVEDYNHNIHCHNLSGQIFRIKKDTCTLLFQIPDSLMSHEFSYEFDNTNKLTVSTNRLFQVNENQKISFLTLNRILSTFPILRTPSKNLIVFNCLNENLITIKNSKAKKKNLPVDKNYHPSMLYHNNKMVSYDRISGLVIPSLSESANPEFPTFEKHNNLTRYYSTDGNYWICNLSGGVYIYDKHLKALNAKPNFKSHIISALMKDNEGNIILGTFGSGLIIIPNLNIQDIAKPSEGTKVTRITSSNNGYIYFGTQKGGIYQVDTLSNSAIIKEKGIQQIELLEFLANRNSLFINNDNANIFSLDQQKWQGINASSVKDIYPKNKDEYILATNKGLLLYNTKHLIDHTKKYQRQPISNFKGRVNCVGYDNLTNTIYSGSAIGLKIGNNDSAYYYKLNNKPILCNDILKVDDNIIISTSKHGVLIFKDEKLIDQWGTKNGLLSNHNKIIKVYDNKLYISSRKGLNIINKDGIVINTINKSDGLNANNIVDFEIVDNVLWVVTNKGIQKINLNKLQTSHFQPSINIDNITVNGSRIDQNKIKFNYHQKKFEFDISSKSLKNKSDIIYYYQLEGIDDSWEKNSYQNHIIEYKSLPPNNYTFKVKAKYKLNESETLKYSFIIEKPFWERWWFYLAIVLFFLALTFYVYKIQIKRQRKKASLQTKLSLTQLTALKSQMNPHFIFNSLNSIQDLVLQQDRENAYNYISKFALLVRKILHHSDKNLIDIEEEMKILKVYLELEELRFKNDFSFTIEDNGITDIEIPPMLIQPFVENALKHGLLHKSGDKLLGILFKLSNEVLTCTIRDNGIGRQKSSEIKLRQNKSHDSFSVKSISNRFDILKDLYGEDIGIVYSDILKNNQVCGTEVILKIPFKRRF